MTLIYGSRRKYLPNLELRALNNNPEKLQLELCTTVTSALCPLCRRVATRIHSHYTRTLRDLPCIGRPLELLLHLRKFFCDWPDCPRHIFTQRLNALAKPWARLTAHLTEIVTTIGLATGGRLGSRLARKLGISVSRTSIIRRLMELNEKTELQVPLLGIDDFSFRRGRVFGTILVDLSQHKVIDILADREVETVVAWLKRHPEIEVISRDRGAEYAQASRLGAPQALQVADRFQLIKNLAEVVELVLIRRFSHLKKVGAIQAVAAMQLSQAEAKTRKRRSARNEIDSKQIKQIVGELAGKELNNKLQRTQHYRYLQRLEEYQQAAQLLEQGYNYSEVAQQLGRSGRTIKRWVREGLPSRLRRGKASRLDSYAAYLQKRWQEGCHNALQLWRELQAQGYPHSNRMVSQFVKQLREAQKEQKVIGQIKPAKVVVNPVDTATNSCLELQLPIVSVANALPVANGGLKETELITAPITAIEAVTSTKSILTLKSAVWLLVKKPEDLDGEEQANSSRICEADGEIAELHRLVQAFRQMLQERTGEAEQLAEWCGQAKASGIAELVSFVRGIAKDREAVIAGLSTKYSNGQVEGQNTKLKLIKRMMYGRASVELLRKRLINAI